MLDPQSMTPSPKNFTDRFHRIIIRTGLVLFLMISFILIAVSFFVRDRLHDQILHRDAFMLQKIAQAIYENSDSAYFDLFDVALQSSELSGVLAIRIYNPDGSLNERFPASVFPVSLGNQFLTQINKNQPVNHFFPDFSPAQLFDDYSFTDELATSPVSRILVPLNDVSGNIVAIIEYWIDSETLLTEFKAIDRRILSLTPAALLLSGLMLGIILKLSLSSVQNLANTLHQRNKDLEKANASLALSAKTSALGAISAHLFHDLKNPLAGLKTILSNSQSTDELSGEASALASRIQKMVNETLQFIHIEGKDYAPELSLSELADNLRRKFDEEIPAKEVTITVSSDGNSIIPGQQIPLITLILNNLVRNSIDAATGKNGDLAVVKIQLQKNQDLLEIDVIDQSGGIPATIASNLFSPQKSNKTNGSGLGLAISAELARKMDGQLTLAHTDDNGSIIKLIIPQ